MDIDHLIVIRIAQLSRSLPATLSRDSLLTCPNVLFTPTQAARSNMEETKTVGHVAVLTIRHLVRTGNREGKGKVVKGCGEGNGRTGNPRPWSQNLVSWREGHGSR